jgi:hypothetical protein
MTTTREQLLERIRKLLDRAKRDAGVEGRRAREVARRLMQQNGITAADLTLTSAPHVHFERSPARSVDVDVMKVNKGKKIPIRVRVGRGIEIRFEL